MSKLGKKYVVTIRDTDSRGVLSPGLEDILEVIGSQRLELPYWYIDEFDGVTQDSANLSLKDIQKNVDENAGHWRVDWDCLLNIAQHVYQTYETIIVGGDVNVSATNIDQKRYVLHPTVVIECVDSSFWQIKTNMKSLVNEFDEKFQKVYVESRGEKGSEPIE